MRVSKLLLVLLSSMATSAAAAEKTIWECRTEHANARPILHLVEWGSQSYVKFAHMRFSASHESDGAKQAWYWNNDGAGYYRYGVVVDPDGRGWYHDFSQTDAAGLSEPLDHFRCKPI